MRGRKPKLKVAVMGERNDPVSHRPARGLPLGGYFEPTAELGPMARVEWARIRSLCPWIGPGSAKLLTERCRLVDQLAAFEAQVEAEGYTMRTTQTVIRHPLLATINQTRRFIFDADKELGLTPVSQSRVGGGQKESVDPLDEAMFA